MDNEFGKKLKNMMRSNKVGRPAVAGKLGVTARTVSRYGKDSAFGERTDQRTENSRI